MNEFLISAASCFLFGLMTTFHPCPLTTNSAAVSMLIGWYRNKKQSAGIIFLFVAGYMISYIAVAIILSAGVGSITLLNNIFQAGITIFLGPVLILVGMLFADLLDVNRLYRGRVILWIQKKNWSSAYAFPMGFLIALSFCPATAGIFFGLLLPIVIDQKQYLLFPLLYASGALIPLILVSYIVYRGSIRVLNEIWQEKISKIAGWIMIFIGIVITIRHIYL